MDRSCVFDASNKMQSMTILLNLFPTLFAVKITDVYIVTLKIQNSFRIAESVYIFLLKKKI